MKIWPTNVSVASMRVLVVIPARAGSKTVPRKNLAVVGGKPLMAYAIENALRITRARRVIFSTEDPEIASVARELGIEVPFIRPPELAEDQVSLIPVALHAARWMSRFGFDAEAVALLQPTAPLLRPESVDRAIGTLCETRCDSVTTVAAIGHGHPYRAYWLDEAQQMKPLHPEGETYLQKQDRPTLFAPTGGLFLRQRTVLENWSGNDLCLGKDRRGVAVEQEEALNIDTPQDLEYFRFLMAQRTVA